MNKTPWIAIAIDWTKRVMVILGVAETEEESLKQHARAGDTSYYKKSFPLLQTDGKDFVKWFRSCGIPRHECHNLVRRIGQFLEEILEEKQNESAD